MQIIFLSRLYNPHIGGVETHVAKLSQALRKKGHTITVITSQHDPGLPLYETISNVKIVRIPHHLLDSKFKLWFWMLEHIGLFKTADLIHAHDVFWWFLPLKFLIFKPIFTTFHGWEGRFPPTHRAILWRKLAELLSCGHICVGEFITHWYHTKASVIIYGATDQKPLGPNKGQGILVLGRLDPDNDLDIIIGALKTIQKHRRNLKITFVGDGPLAAKAGKVGTVHGFQSDISKYLEHNNLVITSSYLSMLDAMATGRRVFSVYSNPLKKDYLRLHPASNRFTAHSDPDSLAQALNLYLRDPSPDSVKITSAKRWASKQTWSHLADTYLKLWHLKMDT